jgi:hypothetical protein
VNLSGRLLKAMQGGNLTVADLARWFDRPDPTVRGWVSGVAPAGARLDLDDIEGRLRLLEWRIRHKECLPLPPRLSPSQRRAALNKIAPG